VRRHARHGPQRIVAGPHAPACFSRVVRFAPEALIRGAAAGTPDRNRHRLRKTCGPPYNKAAAALSGYRGRDRTVITIKTADSSTPRAVMSIADELDPDALISRLAGPLSPRPGCNKVR